MRADLALDAADAEPAGDAAPRRTSPSAAAAPLSRLAVVGGHPAHLDLGVVGEPAGAQRLGHRQVGVGEVDVLADQRDSDGLVRARAPGAAGRPTRSSRRRGTAGRAGAPRRRRVPRGAAPSGCRRSTARPAAETTAVDVDVAHQRDLVLERLGHVAVAAQDRSRPGWMPMLRSAATECWVGLVFSSPDGADVRHQRHVQEEAVLPADLVADLAGRLQERQRLDVADRAADLGDDHVRTCRRRRVGHRA